MKRKSKYLAIQPVRALLLDEFAKSINMKT